jgi:hypothetical protein
MAVEYLIPSRRPSKVVLASRGRAWAAGRRAEAELGLWCGDELGGGGAEADEIG